METINQLFKIVRQSTSIEEKIIQLKELHLPNNNSYWEKIYSICDPHTLNELYKLILYLPLCSHDKEHIVWYYYKTKIEHKKPA